MTIKEQITRLLNKAQHPMTNREIARKIRRPEPSVRRATLALETDFQIHAFAVGPNQQISWAAAAAPVSGTGQRVAGFAGYMPLVW